MAYKLVYLARRAATVSRDDWPKTWKSHAIFASQFPVLEAKIDWMRYCNRVDDSGVPGLSQRHDGVAVAASDDLGGLTGAGFSAEDRARIDSDELRVFDRLTPYFTWYCREQPVLAGEIGEAAVFTFLKRKAGLGREAFEERWCGRNADIAAQAVHHVPAITRYVHNRPLGDPLPLFPFDGIAECWFSSLDEAVQAFRGEALNPLRQDLAEFCDLAGSEAVLTRVCHRWPKA